jgi:predicted phage terminase large subunit-like protein
VSSADDAQLRKDLSRLAPLDLAFLQQQERWLAKARDNQVLPIDGWSLAIARAGRGWGKTEVGANWAVRECCLYPGIVLHAVAPSHADLIGTMFNGISGVMSVCPPELIEGTNFSAAIPTIKFKNGSLIRGFSAQSPERLRGPQASRVWGDEVAAWGVGAEATLMNIDMSTRIAYKCADGRLVQPQRLYTTTPKPLAWLADLLKRAQIVINGSTYENKANLAEDFLRDISMYEGTNIGRQEIHGELIDIAEAAIIKQSWLRIWPNSQPLPWFDFVMVVMDTAFTEKTFDKKTFDRDPTCCQVWGVFSHERRWNLMLLERWSDQVGFPELVRRAKKEMRDRTYGRRTEVLFKPLIGNALHAEQMKRPDLLMIEDKGSGISLRQMLATEGIDSWPYNPGKADKLARLHAVSHVAHAGRVWLPESTNPAKKGVARNWVLPMIDEVCIYSGPGTTKHDDDVDCYSMANRYFADRWLSAGVDGKILIEKDTQLVNVSSALAGEEWIEGEDRLPGMVGHNGGPELDDFVNPYYG